MPTFTIDSDNNISVHATLPAGTESRSFSSAKELAKLAAEWPAKRLVETWNSFAGVAPFDDLKPVKKFTNRKAAIVRIWQAVARLSPDAAEPAAHDAPNKGKATKSSRKEPRQAPEEENATESRSNKKAGVIEMMKRARGVTLVEIMEATGWQKHTIRGFVSILASKGGKKIESLKNATGERTYRIVN